MFKHFKTQTADSHSHKPAYIYIYIAIASLIIGLFGIIGLNWNAQASDFPEIQEQAVEGNSATTHMALKADDTKLSFICPSVINFAMKANGEFITPSAGQAYIENLSLMPLRMKSYTVTSDAAAKGMISTTSTTDDNAYEVKVKTQLGNPTPFAVTQSALTSSEWSMTKAGSDTPRLDLTFSDGKMINITNRWGSGAHLQDVVWNATADVNRQVVVQFDSTGGSAVPDQVLSTGGKATAPTAPTREGFKFEGWYTDSACMQDFDFEGTSINQYTLLFAKWKEASFTGLTMTANAPSQVSYTHDSRVFSDSDVKVKIKDKDSDFRKIESDEVQNLVAGDVMFVKGSNPEGFSHYKAGYGRNHFNVTGDVSLSGNLNSVLDDNDGSSIVSVPEYCYAYMFFKCYGLSSLSAGLLPATQLAHGCYWGMFTECSGLSSLPVGLLPVTELAEECYYGMFTSCSGLSSLPEGLLPAAQLAKRCYSGMFGSCYGLSSLPEGLLPATQLADYCYENMFGDCSGLSSLPEGLLSVTQLVEGCYSGMFSGCFGLSSLPEGLLPAAQLAKRCYWGMFSSCFGLSSLPEGLLPATQLADYCYEGMFTSCEGLSSLPEGLLPATQLADYCYEGMFTSCEGLSSLPEGLLPATSLTDHCYEYMFTYCYGLSSLPEGLLPATQLADYCYNSMFMGCSWLLIADHDFYGGTKIFTCPDTSGLNDPASDMFTDTAGDFQGTPTSGNSYYCY